MIRFVMSLNFILGRDRSNRCATNGRIKENRRFKYRDLLSGLSSDLKMRLEIHYYVRDFSSWSTPGQKRARTGIEHNARL